MKTRKFEKDGKLYNSIMDIAREVGVSRIRPQQFEKYGIKELVAGEDNTVDDLSDETKETVTKNNKAVITEDVGDDVVLKKDADRDTYKSKVCKRVGTQEEIDEVVSKVANMSLEEFYKYIRNFSIEALLKMSAIAGTSSWDTISDISIKRMHLMADIKKHYFPGQKLPKKGKSRWGSYSLDELKKIADENSVEYKKFSDDKIQRMRLSMALDKADVKIALEDASGN